MDIMWLKMASPRLNEDYIKKLLLHFKISNYSFIQNGYNDYDVMLTHRNNTYKVLVDEESSSLVLMKRNQCGNKKSREFYHYLDEIYSKDCWFDVLKRIVGGNS